MTHRPPRPAVPAGAVLADAAELERLLDSGASRQEVRAWLAEQTARAEHEGRATRPDAGR